MNGGKSEVCKMNIHNIIFKINDTEKIIIELKEPLDNVDCCYQECINFYKGNKNLCNFSTDTIRYNLKELASLLSQALENKLQLHKSITKDIGYLANEADQEKLGISYINHLWVGRRYALFGGNLNEKTYLYSWIYNDKDSNIIFEITPKYKWHFSEPKKGESYIPYEEWIKTYKPFLIRKIPVEVACQWLDQATSILNKIEENMAKLTVEALEREKKEKEQIASSRDADEEK
jgi:hypothetical protein